MIFPRTRIEKVLILGTCGSQTKSASVGAKKERLTC